MLAQTEEATNVYRTPWAGLIRAAKSSLSCWSIDNHMIWDRFVAFNRARGNAAVPAGFLLGFMRRWRTSPNAPASPNEVAKPLRVVDRAEQELQSMIKAAPIANRQFHASDLRRAIGPAAYEVRVLNVMEQFDCPKFAATLAVHGKAVMMGEISR